MDLTTSARLKNFVPGTPNTETDSALSQIISGVSRQIANYLGVRFTVKEVTEYYDIEHRSTSSVFVKRPPVHEITSIYNDSDREYTSASLMDATEYDFDGDALLFPDYLLEEGLKALKVTYVGGYAFDNDYYVSRINDGATVSPSTGDIYLVGDTPAGDFSAATANQLATWGGASWSFSDQITGLIASKPEIVSACEAQCATIFQKRGRMGSKYTAIKSSQTTYSQEALTPEVKGMLSMHRRLKF